MRKLLCDNLGRIYYIRVNDKTHTISERDKRDVTDGAIDAVAEHMKTMIAFKQNKLSFYNWQYKDGSHATLALYDSDKYKIVEKEEENE